MTWSLNATGTAENADDEQFLIDDLRAALTSDAAGPYTATLVTTFHGTVDLLANVSGPEPTADDAGGAEGEPEFDPGIDGL